MSENLTLYDICKDETRSLTEADLKTYKNVYSAFALQHECGKALAWLALAVGQDKVSYSDALNLLKPLTDWAAEHSV